MTKDMMSKAYSDFCKEKGVEKMNLVEYKSHGNDVPVKDYLLRRAFGSSNPFSKPIGQRFFRYRRWYGHQHRSP